MMLSISESILYRYGRKEEIVNRLIEIIESSPEIAELLQHCPYSVLKKFQVKEYARGKFKLEQGTIYSEVYIIVQGKIDIFILSDSGRKITLDIYGPGNLIGEHELLQKIPFSSSVQSLSDVVLLKLSRESFLEWMELDRGFARNLTESLCNQIYQLSKRIESYSLFSTKRQVVVALSSLSKGDYIERKTLLKRISSTPRSVDRVLKELKDLELIEMDNGVIKLRNPGLLIELGSKE
ncbi:Crp/Fnr family transcriptional regulator [Paenibacillus albiflavus]|uniref:Crp/Fnr family transcriptional regulator n=1 Tax=Paenibacillus albiflavus TaxID=2545760 RepID=A0A4R4EKI5_9BACL|nr:Crp/Fnr family transcriptional regulator [Paenibacillus albiflavus]TCZ80726.1 Crp/Fnr family transcriptional regulator [Paenibacillus albiflavus]